MTIKEPELVDALRAVADPTRLKILKLLRQKGCCSIDKDVGMCACDVEAKIGLSQPTISHHMGILRQAGLVQATKVGQWMWYRLDEKALKEVFETLGALWQR